MRIGFASFLRPYLLCMLGASLGLLGLSPGQADEPAFRGKIVLFGVQREGDMRTSLMMMNRDGSGLETLFTVEDDRRSITGGRVAPDSRSIAFTVFDAKTHKGEVWIRDSQGGRRKVADDATVRAWSPDGTKLACVNGRLGEWKSFVLDLPTGKTSPLSIPDVNMVDDWSPIGDELAIMLGRPDRLFKHPEKGDYALRQIGLMKESGGDQRLVPTDPAVDYLWPRFSPDGKRVTHYQREYTTGEPVSFSMIRDCDGGRAVAALTYSRLDEDVHKKPQGRPYWEQEGAGCWSEDGKTVAWLVDNQKSINHDAAQTKLRYVVVFTTMKGEIEGRVDLRKLGLVFVAEMDWGR